MFIRRTKTRTSCSGQQYYSYRLVDTFRVAERVRQRTLLNLGGGFSVPPEHWKPLVQRIEQIVVGQYKMLPAWVAEVEREAQNIAASLSNKYAASGQLLSPQKGQTKPSEIENMRLDLASDRDLRGVDLDSPELMNSRSVGGEAVALSALLRVGLDDKLQALGFNTK